MTARFRFGSTSVVEQDAVTTLVAGSPIERTIAAGPHTYLVRLEAGQFARVDVEQDGVDALVTLTGPDGQLRAEVEDGGRPGGVEQVRIAADLPGAYRLEVASRVRGAMAGRYRIAIGEQRPATQEDFDRAAAERLYNDAHALRLKTGDARRQATDKYAEAVARWTTLGDVRRQGQTLFYLALTHRGLGERAKAFEIYNQALIKFQEMGDRQWEGRTLLAIGLTHIEAAEYAKSLPSLEQAILLSQQTGDALTTANALYNGGRAHDQLSQSDKAMAVYEDARRRFRALGDRGGTASATTNAGIAARLLGDWPKALDYYRQALDTWRVMNDRRGEALTLNNMAIVYSDMGEYQQAIAHSHQSLEAYRRAGAVDSEAFALNGLGWAHYLLGEPDRAAQYYQQSLPIARAAKNRRLEAALLNNIGLAHAASGRVAEALALYHEALPIKRSVGDRRQEALTLMDIGVAEWALGRHPQALEYDNQALAIHRDVKNPQGESETLSNIGLVFGSLGDHERSLASYQQALEIQRAIGDRKNEATTLLGMARAYRALGRLGDARTHVVGALNNIESLRTNVHIQDLRAAFLASNRTVYDVYVDILMRLHDAAPIEGHSARALVVSEQARARSLLDALREAAANISEGIDPKTLERARDLQQRVSSQHDRLVRVLSGAHTDEQAAAARASVDAAVAAHDSARNELRSASPRYAALTEVQPLSVEDIQTGLLDADSMLLEYSLGDERSFVWAITRDRIASYVLPNRAEIERAARQVYELLTARNKYPDGETPGARASRLRRADAEYHTAAATLSEMLLGPVGNLRERKRLVVVAEGALQYIPFGVLPLPTAVAPDGAKTAAQTPILTTHEVVNLPSISVSQCCGTNDRAVDALPRLWPSWPILCSTRTIPRVSTAAATRKPTTADGPAGSTARDVSAGSMPDVMRSAAEAGVASLARLRFTRQEADTIVSLVAANQSFKALDFAANRAIATSDALGRYRIVHFATHGLINSVHPELSGLVLSMVDERGQPQDGFVRLHDIYNLKLQADLVVLSACQTALGKDIRGEGLVGLTRGFMYAGAQRVVASLWDVEDRATADLMKRFYEGMLVRGLTAASAHREAQLAVMRDRRWAHPYYWGAFVLQGDWR